MIHQIYLCILLLVTIAVLVYYFIQEGKHKKELEKINRMEVAYKQDQQRLESIRSQTTPCQAGTYTDPRSCYMDSGYTCSWNEQSRRCDQNE